MAPGQGDDTGGAQVGSRGLLVIVKTDGSFAALVYKSKSSVRILSGRESGGKLQVQH